MAKPCVELDVAVVGAGPAGLALAVACAERGLRVGVMDPALNTPWVPNYGAWLDELAAVGAEQVVAHRWSKAQVRTQTAVHTIDRPYVQVNGQRLQAMCQGALRAAGGYTLAEAVVAVEHGPTHSVLRTSKHRSIRASVAIDATGRGHLLTRAPTTTCRWQTGWGEWVTASAHPFDLDTMVLMDFSRVSDADRVPTFLYAMPFDRNRVFIEETALSANPPVGFEVLQQRLQARKAGLNLPVDGITRVEKCRIALNRGLPTSGQRMIGYGAAAGFTHPATGYQLVHALGRARATAEAIARSLTDPATERSMAIWRVVLPTQARRSHALLGLAMSLIDQLSPTTQAAFFVRFFQGNHRAWRVFLAGNAGPSALALSMLRVAKGLRPGLQFNLLRAVALHGFLVR